MVNYFAFGDGGADRLAPLLGLGDFLRPFSAAATEAVHAISTTDVALRRWRRVWRR